MTARKTTSVGTAQRRHRLAARGAVPALALTLVAGTTSAAGAADVGVIVDTPTGGNANVRSAPSVNASVVDVLPDGTRLPDAECLTRTADTSVWTKLFGDRYVRADLTGFDTRLPACGAAPQTAPPAIAAGEQVYTDKQRWAFGPTAYEANITVSFRWTGGANEGESKVYDVRGAVSPQANFVYQVTSERGFETEAGVPVDKDDEFPGGVTLVGKFKSRACPTGDFDVLCSGWANHEVRFRLTSAGEYQWLGAS